jgi:hypothetical protein
MPWTVLPARASLRTGNPQGCMSCLSTSVHFIIQHITYRLLAPCRLDRVGFDIGARLIELLSWRERALKRKPEVRDSVLRCQLMCARMQLLTVNLDSDTEHTSCCLPQILDILRWVHSVAWPAVFGKNADDLQQAREVRAVSKFCSAQRFTIGALPLALYIAASTSLHN